MRVLAGQRFHARYGARAQEIVPGLQWVLLDGEGRWSGATEDAELAVYSYDTWAESGPLKEGRLFRDTVLGSRHLRWLHTMDAGTDGPFYAEVRGRGALLTNSSGTNAVPVAEFCLAMMLWSAKNLGTIAANQRRRVWAYVPASELTGQMVVIVGVGSIGREVARRAKPFGMRVVGVRRQAQERLEEVDQLLPPRELRRALAEADYVIVAVPLTEETRHMIGRGELEAMKPTAVLINVARGPVVDEPALVMALRRKRIAGACLDVFHTEPLPPDSPLWGMKNVFVSPHNAYASPLWDDRVAALWLDNLSRYVRNEPMVNRC